MAPVTGIIGAPYIQPDDPPAVDAKSRRWLIPDQDSERKTVDGAGEQLAVIGHDGEGM